MAYIKNNRHILISA